MELYLWWLEKIHWKQEDFTSEPVNQNTFSIFTFWGFLRDQTDIYGGAGGIVIVDLGRVPTYSPPHWGWLIHRCSKQTRCTVPCLGARSRYYHQTIPRPPPATWISRPCPSRVVVKVLRLTRPNSSTYFPLCDHCCVHVQYLIRNTQV